MTTTVIDATNAFLSNVSKSRSPLTARAYRNVLLGHQNGFLPRIRQSVKYDDPISKLTEKHAMLYMQEILELSPATRALCAAALRRFYTFIAGNDMATVSLDRLNFLWEGSNVLTPVKRDIEYDAAAIKAFLDWVNAWDCKGNTPTRTLRNLRDRAFILTLSESGLRVHEACKITIKDVDFEKASGVVIGKGHKQARFKIGQSALQAIRTYLDARNALIALEPKQPVFARHDRKAGKLRILPMGTQTGEDIIHLTEAMATGGNSLTCHKLRHYFVTHVLRMTNNLKAAQQLARHTNINVTERYAHLIDEEIDGDFNKAFNV